MDTLYKNTNNVYLSWQKYEDDDFKNYNVYRKDEWSSTSLLLGKLEHKDSTKFIDNTVLIGR